MAWFWLLLYALLIIVPVGFFLWRRSGKRSTGNFVAIVGCKGSGKTALVDKLIFGLDSTTVTSMKERIMKAVTFHSSNESCKPFDLAELPGHERLKGARNNHLPKAGCIVFVVDAANFVVRDSAEFLYDILVHPFVDDHAPPILLLCNKSDLVADGFSSDNMKAMLEAELNNLKESRSGIAVEGADEDTVVMLGMPDQAFSFERDVDSEISVSDCSVKKGQLDGVHDFIRKWSATR